MTVAEEPAVVPQAQAEEPAGKETGERADQEKAQAEPDSQESSPKPDEQPDPMDYSSDYLGVLGNNIGGNVGSAVANYGFLAVHTGSTGTPPAPVVNGPIPDRLSKEAAGAFATPGGFAEAGRTLRDHHMVLLCGTGTGRSVAGVRLLIDRNARSIHRLDVEKPLTALTFDALSSGHGYLWDGMAPGWERRLDDRALQGLSALLECAGSWLVLAVDEAQLPAEGRPWAVALKAPDPREVYRRQLCLRTDSDGTEVNRAFVEQLAPDATPRQAAAAARLQVRVSREGYQPEQALHELSRRTGQEVADWFSCAQP
ncbi:MAG: hypothetical protein ACRDQ5_08730, partial [Sciscionella sp.]